MLNQKQFVPRSCARGETKHLSVTQNNGATENLQSRMSRRNGLVLLSYSLGKASVVIDEMPEEH